MDIGLILIIGSGLFIILGAILWQKGNHLLANGKKARAVIFKNNYESSSSEDGVYYPVVRFKTENEEWITQQLSIGYQPAKREGTKLEVIYDPEDPSNVEINSTFQLVILPRLFVSLGLAGTVLGVLVYLDFIVI